MGTRKKASTPTIQGETNSSPVSRRRREADVRRSERVMIHPSRR